MIPLLLSLAILAMLVSPVTAQNITIYHPDGSRSTGQQAGNAFSVMNENGAYTSGYRDSYGNVTIYQFEGLDRKGQSAPKVIFGDDDGGEGED